MDTAVGWGVGAIVGARVGAGVGDGDGDGLALGDGEGESEGDDVGEAVGVASTTSVADGLGAASVAGVLQAPASTIARESATKRAMAVTRTNDRRPSAVRLVCLVLSPWFPFRTHAK